MLAVDQEAYQNHVHGTGKRISGSFFRAMSSLYLTRHRGRYIGRLARSIRDILHRHGIDYHLRTIKRQLQGTISTVPVEVEMAMRRLLAEDGLRTIEQIKENINLANIDFDQDEGLSAYLPSEQVLPLAHLWFYFNPGKSSRFLARRMQKDFHLFGVGISTRTLQTVFSGRLRLVRREIDAKLLEYLCEHGISSREHALALMRTKNNAITKAFQGRKLVDSRRFVKMCRLWQILHSGRSLRQLALLLERKLSKKGITCGHHHLQDVANGKRPLVRASVELTIRELLKEKLSNPRELALEISRLSKESTSITDLCWVRSSPVVSMARDWLNKHEGVSIRKLSFILHERVLRMGYSISPASIQLILAGKRAKMRGFVYHAMAEEMGSTSVTIPGELLISKTWKDIPDSPSSPSIQSGLESNKSEPSLEEFLEEARRYLPKARSPHFLPFMAYRAANIYGIPRRRAEQMIKEPSLLRERK